MFGVKIIKKCKYEYLQSQEKEREMYEREYNKQVRDNNHLRDQLNSEMRKVQELKEQDSIMSSLNQYHIVRESSYPCSNCNIESENCKKIAFADSTICVCPKEEVVSFRQNPNKKAKKPTPRV